MYRGLRLDATGCIQINNSEIGGNYHSPREKLLTFGEYAKEELSELSSEEKNERFIIIYRSFTYTYHAMCNNIKKVARLALAPQNYICNPMLQTITACNKTGIYYKDAKGRYKELWTTGLLREDKNAIFLQPEKLNNALKKVFAEFTLTLGKLSVDNMNYIAWQISTNEGIYYLLWHNACLCKHASNFTFDPHSIEDLKGIYKVLKFAHSDINRREFKTVSA